MADVSRVAVACRVRPLLAHEALRAPWRLLERSIGLARLNRSDALPGKSRQELRPLEHLRSEHVETVMDRVFDQETTTWEVYESCFRRIVLESAEGMNGCIMAYGQTASGKTYSISGSTGKEKGMIHFALEDLFQRLKEKAGFRRF